MPAGAELLTVQPQHAGTLDSAPVLWAIVDHDAPTETRRFQIVATGAREVGVGLRYIGTFQEAVDPYGDAVFVGHVFEHMHEEDPCGA